MKITLHTFFKTELIVPFVIGMKSRGCICHDEFLCMCPHSIQMAVQLKTMCTVSFICPISAEERSFGIRMQHINKAMPKRNAFNMCGMKSSSATQSFFGLLLMEWVS